MKINEVAVREAEPNYEVNPAQARLAAIANKLMDKSATTTVATKQIHAICQPSGSKTGL